MSITRKMLKGMGLTEEQQDAIFDAHTETVNEIKTERDRYKSEAERLPDVQRQLDELKTAGDGGYKEKYEKEHKDFEEYKAGITAKETRAAKEKAVRAYLESKNITGSGLTIAMRGLGAEIDAAELDGEKLKDTRALDDLISGDLAGLVTKTSERGAPPPANPPRNNNGKLTREEIYKKDDKGRYVLSASERQKALIENQII